MSRLVTALGLALVLMAAPAAASTWQPTAAQCGDGGTLWVDLDNVADQECRAPKVATVVACDTAGAPGIAGADGSCWTAARYDAAYPAAGLENPANHPTVAPSSRLLGADMGTPVVFAQVIARAALTPRAA